MELAAASLDPEHEKIEFTRNALKGLFNWKRKRQRSLRTRLRYMDHKTVEDRLPLAISELKSVKPQYKAIMRARKEKMEHDRNRNMAIAMMIAAGAPLGEIEEMLSRFDYEID